MKKVVLTSSLAMSLAVALTSCSSGSGGQAAPDENRLAELAVTTPTAVGDLGQATWNLPFGEPASLDPILAFNYPESTVVANICEGLMMIQPDFSVTPNLAESFDTQDGQTYVYQLRQGVTFWDGSPMTAQDVVYSLGRHVDPEEGSYWSSDAVSGNIASIEATSDTEVTLTLKKPDWTFNSYMATPMGIVVSEEHRKATGEAYGTPQGGVMCTGPFSVADWKSGQSVTLAKNESYWNTERTPKVSTLEIQFIVDPAAITNALVSGAIDGSYDVPLSAVSQLEQTGTGQLVLGKSMQLLAIIPTGDGPLGDPAVRRALWTATDQAALSATVFEGTARPSVSLVPDGGWSYADDTFSAARAELPGAEADIAKAKEILAEAKVDLSETISIVYPSERSYYADMISELARAGKEIGLDVQPQGVPSAQFGAFFSDAEARAGHGAFVTTNYMDVPDPLVFLRTIVQDGGSQNFSGYSNPEIEELLNKAQNTASETERAELTAELEALAMQDMPWLPIVDPAVRLFMSDRITGAPASFAYLYYPWAADLGAAE